MAGGQSSSAGGLCPPMPILSYGSDHYKAGYCTLLAVLSGLEIIEF